MIYQGPPLEDGRLSLSNVRASDMKASIAAEDAAEWLGWVSRAESDASMLYFGIFRGDQLAGQIFLHDTDVARRETLIGYHILRPGDRGQGIGTRALRLLQQYLAGMPSIVRAVIITSVDNVASQQLARRCGFTYVGPTREGPGGMVFEWQTRS
jgi:RimJ/RimL family protein N-acetyltransferase